MVSEYSLWSLLDHDDDCSIDFYHVMSYHIISCHVMSSRVMSCHLASCHVVSSNVILCHLTSFYVVSCHVMSCLYLLKSNVHTVNLQVNVWIKDDILAYCAALCCTTVVEHPKLGHPRCSEYLGTVPSHTFAFSSAVSSFVILLMVRYAASVAVEDTPHHNPPRVSSIPWHCMQRSCINQHGLSCSVRVSDLFFAEIFASNLHNQYVIVSSKIW